MRCVLPFSSSGRLPDSPLEALRLVLDDQTLLGLLHAYYEHHDSCCGQVEREWKALSEVLLAWVGGMSAVGGGAGTTSSMAMSQSSGLGTTTPAGHRPAGFGGYQRSPTAEMDLESPSMDMATPMSQQGAQASEDAATPDMEMDTPSTSAGISPAGDKVTPSPPGARAMVMSASPGGQALEGSDTAWNALLASDMYRELYSSGRCGRVWNNLWLLR